MFKVSKKMIMVLLTIAVCLGLFALFSLREGFTPMSKISKIVQEEEVESDESRFARGSKRMPFMKRLPRSVTPPSSTPTPNTPSTGSASTSTPVSGIITSGQQQQQSPPPPVTPPPTTVTPPPTTVTPPPTTVTPPPTTTIRTKKERAGYTYGRTWQGKEFYNDYGLIYGIEFLIQAYIKNNQTSPVISQLQNLLNTNIPNLKQKINDIIKDEPTQDDNLADRWSIVANMSLTPPYPETDKLALIGSYIEVIKLNINAYITANPGTPLMYKLNDLTNSLTQFNQQLAAIHNQLPGVQQITTFIPWIADPDDGRTYYS